jgi:hypothetical protein
MNYRCLCGEVISTSPSPHPDGLLLAPEEVLQEAEVEAERSVSSAFDTINDGSVQAYRCPRCARLMVFQAGRGDAPTFYKAETIE